MVIITDRLLKPATAALHTNIASVIIHTSTTTGTAGVAQLHATLVTI